MKTAVDDVVADDDDGGGSGSLELILIFSRSEHVNERTLVVRKLAEAENMSGPQKGNRSTRNTSPKCDTPQKPATTGGVAFKGEPQQSASIGCGSECPTEPDTDTGSPAGHTIARKQLFDQHGAAGGTSSTAPSPPFQSRPNEQDLTTDGVTGTTPKPRKSTAAQLSGTPARYRLSTETPPRSANQSSHRILTTSTPIQGSGSGARGKVAGQSRNGSLESPGAPLRSADTSANSEAGWRNKTNSPCLGDFILSPQQSSTSTSTVVARSHKSTRRSPLVAAAGSNAGTPAENSSLFQEHDFPQLSGSSTPQRQEQPAGVGGSSGKQRVAPQRRRIAPTTVSRSVSGRHDFTSSSLKTENNLVALGGTDEEQDPHGMLRRLKDEIRTDFEAVRAQQPEPVLAAPVAPEPEAGPEETAVPPIQIDFSKVTQRATVERLAAIYAHLLDLNLVPNVLNELACLINLVSADRYGELATPNDLSGILRNPHNCVLFATEVLHRQRAMLALLDTLSLRVLAENERLEALRPSLTGFLRQVLARKAALGGTNGVEEQSADGADHHLPVNCSLTNVFYQQENDTKDHFPSAKEFGAFNKQRDSFYAILRIWEEEHLSPAWEFEAKLGAKVRAMLNILQHPINMAHLAKLFSAQLIISFNFDNSATELQMALPSIDLTKLSKLRQRLVAPSLFSTQYLFPGSQTFFRDFIVASEHHPMFTEQLKAVLLHELLQLNGSSYDICSIADAKNQTLTEYVARPETIATMRVLAKFLGFVIARPFQYEGARCTMVENRQLELRNSLLPLFDVKPVLLRSVADRKLVITIPWLVQYLSMLDAVTLRLRYYEELFQMVHDIYQATAMCGRAASRHLFVLPTSKFIVRSCLDWLFDQPNVPEEYFHPSADYNDGSLTIEKLAMERFGMLNAEEQHSSNVATSVKRTTGGGKNILVEDVPTAFNPLLESVLSAACPFLADFRVAVMPSKLKKTVSRTGRYRHITTRFSGTATTQPDAANESQDNAPVNLLLSKSANQSASNQSAKLGPGSVQVRLVEAFLQSQSLSLRRTVEFVVERITSAAIKDFQLMCLLPEKKATTERIGAVRGRDVKEVAQQIYAICNEGLGRINATWESRVPHMLSKRITNSLDALLPEESIDAVRRTCKNIALEKCLQKTSEWRQSYMSDVELFCRNVQSEADSIVSKSLHQRPQQKLVENPTTPAVNQTSLSISPNSAIVPSDVFGSLQLLMNYAAVDPSRLSEDGLAELLQQIQALLDEPGITMTSAMYRMLAYMLLQLFLLLIKSCWNTSVLALVQAAIGIWKHPKLRHYCLPPEDAHTLPMSPSQEQSLGYPAQIEQYRQKQKQQEENYVFSHLVSNRMIRMIEQNERPYQNYHAYDKFITALLDAELITIDLLNGQFTTVFNEDWPMPTLERVQKLIDQVLLSNRPKRSGHNIDDSHTELYSQMLSDITNMMKES